MFGKLIKAEWRASRRVVGLLCLAVLLAGLVLGGIGSITGSIIGSLLFVASSEWWLRGLDSGTFLGINAPTIFRNGFRLVVFSVIIMVVVLFFRKGIMGERELPDLLRGRTGKEAAK